ncbi:MAG: lipid-A-disaccharide synthase N-terminal domain-containing protein [Cyclobacteriaceae bacterium]|nr:lipid-A-disaccharide synthase N-terminal domain-containing protein [Cyclobacteriaceae bacterium]
MSNSLIFSVGFLAQILFASRTLVQWIATERCGRVVSPLLFWQLSLVACTLMLGYGIMRHDLAILLGQSITYFVYIRNLQFKNAWAAFPGILRRALIGLPGVVLAYVFFKTHSGYTELWNNPEISLSLLLWGSAGHLVFSGRFIYQWYYSEKLKTSLLPQGFWTLSVAGAVAILIYAVMRKDPVLLAGQGAGLVIYLRNLYLGFSPFATNKNAP